MMRQNIGESAPGLASVCTKLFVDATRPLCLFLAEWLSRGIHCDPSDEFPVVRVTSIAAEGRNAPQEVWESYALRCNCEDKDAASPLQRCWCQCCWTLCGVLVTEAGSMFT
eukprot:m.992046 g.992046  ORF g.992046 m.992046 type:complete len:111 (-) comp24004_c0_seq3:1899-2231(-)